MIFLIKRRHVVSVLLSALIVLSLLASCSNENKSAPEEEPLSSPVETSPDYPAVIISPAPVESISEYPDEAVAVVEIDPDFPDETVAMIEAPVEPLANENRIDAYRVELGADETLKIPGIPGELRVWIGSPDHSADFPERMIRDETSVPALGDSAKVEPFAPAFEIDPPETECIKIHPSGSEVRFKLTPKKQGTFEVGANVYLFDSIDCSGSPIPKTAATLKVLVEVNQKDIFLGKLSELWDAFWEKFVEFWGALLAIFFGLLLFLIRGKLKKWFGYEE